LSRALSSLKSNSFSVILPKHIRIADAMLRKFDDFLGDQSCRWVVTNFEMQSVTR
jgi:hypothetical protein